MPASAQGIREGDELSGDGRDDELLWSHQEQIREAGADYIYLTMNQAGINLAEQTTEAIGKTRTATGASDRWGKRATG